MSFHERLASSTHFAVAEAPVAGVDIFAMTAPLALHPAQDVGPTSAPLAELVDDCDESIMTKVTDA